MDNIAVSCVLNIILSFHAITSSAIRRDDGAGPVLPPDPKSEDGFNLNQEDMARSHIWQTGIIPYHIDDFSFDKVLRDRIRMYLNEVNRVTALRFEEIPRPPEGDNTRWVLFLNRRGLLRCDEIHFDEFSNSGVQTVVLGYDCMNSDENLAAIVLALVGVPPQHNAPDRDEYVDIIKENILPDKLVFFEKFYEADWLFHNLTYDYDSAGHYGPYKYTSNGNVTVQRKPRDYYFFNNLGPPPPKPKEKGFSTQDVLKMAMLYNYIAKKREIPVVQCSKLYTLAGNKKVAKHLQYNNFKMKYGENPIQYLGDSEKKQVYDENQNGIEDNMNKSENNENYDGDDDENEYEDGNTPEENYKEEGDNNVNDMEQKEDEEDYVNNDDDDGDESYDNIDYYDDDDDSDYDEGYGNIDNYNGYYINKNEGGKEKLNAKKIASSKNHTKLKDKFNDGDKKSGHEDTKSDDKENQKKLSENSNEYNATEIINTFDGTVKSTRKYDRMPLSLKRKIKKSNKKIILGQSDYETGDEGKNKYIHEKNFNY